MVINWYGEGCFKIQSGNLVILTDPLEKESGLTPPRFKADFVLKTQTDYPPLYDHKEVPEIVGPGEYEIKGVEVRGWSANEGLGTRDKGQGILNTVYLVKMEEMNLGLLGHLAKMPEASIVEELGRVDLLFLPAGGPPFLKQEEAAKLIKQINPKLVIAGFFKIPGLKRKAEDVKEFLKELGQKAEPQEKLTIKKKDLPATTQVAVLKV